jgi:actin-related protein
MWSLHFVLAFTIGVLFSIFMLVVVAAAGAGPVVMMAMMKCQFFLLAGDLSCYNYKKKNPGSLCCLLVDSGYSFTHIVPYIKGKKLKQGIRRIDVGGKMLTNHLKEIISYRYCELSKFTWTV